ncbi:MAG TPA: hypothetical protein PKU97_01350 [Kofleriaceae bacterium]|nr:hypothetical protein [Kofleriaceae bacterium]
MSLRRSYLLLTLALASLGAGCGDTLDDRPATREYIVAAILAPACGNGGGHSSATAAEGFAFDTLEAANKALTKLVDPGNRNSELLTVLRTDGESRMPLDGPLPDDDIALIEKWILGGAQ